MCIFCEDILSELQINLPSDPTVPDAGIFPVSCSVSLKLQADVLCNGYGENVEV